LENEGVLKGPLNHDDWRPGDQKVFVGSIDKIYNAIGWTPSTKPSEGINKLITWVKKNKNLLENTLK